MNIALDTESEMGSYIKQNLKKIRTLGNISIDVNLSQLMFWCNTKTKHTNCVGEPETVNKLEN